MKTTRNNQQDILSNVNVSFIGMLLLIFASLMGFSQDEKLKIGLKLSTYVSGNGFGGTFSSGIYLKKGRSLLEVAPNFQYKDSKIKGGSLSYEFSLEEGDASPGNRVDLFVFASGRYFRNASLCKKAAKIERQVNNESKIDFNKAEFGTFEFYAGVGARYCLNQKFKISAGMGFGGYYTYSGQTNVYRETSSPSLTLKTSLAYAIG